ncbi:hypothetical protein B9C88_21595 [Brevibacillus laterosporus]|uniref:YopX family protein n=1 Tax=Brevibacillus laterosporus TaxID=1465 RepID=UPI000BD7D203|nr:YopX family protein [Brevibacillus laterosporus]PCN42296.1 hypothetical protein B9C88_21595 [Brevibacillus laterosporus]
MREIKFRMWDFENQEMINGDSLAFEEYAPISQLLSQKGIMQYTGLKDCNDKEIYEGDIFKDWKGNIRIITWKDFLWVFEVPEKQRKELGHRYEDFHNVGEVIGNIYEHPHLLNQE